jgi:hypothetical protein
MDILTLSHLLCKMRIFYPKKYIIMKYTTFCGGRKGDCAARPKQKLLNMFVD